MTGEIDGHGVEAGRREQLGERAELVEVVLEIVHEDDRPQPGPLDRDPAYDTRGGRELDGGSQRYHVAFAQLTGL